MTYWNWNIDFKKSNILNTANLNLLLMKVWNIDSRCLPGVCRNLKYSCVYFNCCTELLRTLFQKWSTFTLFSLITNSLIFFFKKTTPAGAMRHKPASTRATLVSSRPPAPAFYHEQPRASFFSHIMADRFNKVGSCCGIIMDIFRFIARLKVVFYM